MQLCTNSSLGPQQPHVPRKKSSCRPHPRLSRNSSVDNALSSKQSCAMTEAFLEAIDIIYQASADDSWFLPLATHRLKKQFPYLSSLIEKDDDLSPFLLALGRKRQTLLHTPVSLEDKEKYKKMRLDCAFDKNLKR